MESALNQTAETTHASFRQQRDKPCVTIAINDEVITDTKLRTCEEEGEGSQDSFIDDEDAEPSGADWSEQEDTGVDIEEIVVYLPWTVMHSLKSQEL